MWPLLDVVFNERIQVRYESSMGTFRTQNIMVNVLMGRSMSDVEIHPSISVKFKIYELQTLVRYLKII